MKKAGIFFISVTLISVINSQAAVYKGQRIFTKQCISCHSNAQEFIASKTKSEWKSVMADNGKLLVKVHEKNDKSKDALKYLKSKKFAKKSKHLKQFLIEYAKDSGNVPAF